jgi:molybdate transport system substrate-binding protein
MMQFQRILHGFLISIDLCRNGLKNIIAIYFLLASSLLLFGCQKEEKVHLTVSAAASMTDAMKEISKEYQKLHPEVSLSFNFGSSGVLKQQIKQGAPVDVFMAADEKHVEALIEEGSIKKEDFKKLVSNELMLVASPSHKVKTLREIQRLQRISIGTPETVPAGRYAKEVLENEHMWEELKSKMIFAKDVKHVLSLVESGNVDAGFVYKSDLVSIKKELETVPIDHHLYSKILYSGGVIKHSFQYEEAKRFLEFLTTDAARHIFRKHGFTDVGRE